MIVLNVLEWFITSNSVLTAVFLLMFVFSIFKVLTEGYK